MRKLVRTLNNYFITLILFLSYFPVIGLAFVFYKFSATQKQSPDSYWIDVKQKAYDKHYFRSPY